MLRATRVSASGSSLSYICFACRLRYPSFRPRTRYITTEANYAAAEQALPPPLAANVASRTAIATVQTENEAKLSEAESPGGSPDNDVGSETTVKPFREREETESERISPPSSRQRSMPSRKPKPKFGPLWPWQRKTLSGPGNPVIRLERFLKDRDLKAPVYVISQKKTLKYHGLVMAHGIRFTAGPTKRMVEAKRGACLEAIAYFLGYSSAKAMEDDKLAQETSRTADENSVDGTPDDILLHSHEHAPNLADPLVGDNSKMNSVTEKHPRPGAPTVGTIRRVRNREVTVRTYPSTSRLLGNSAARKRLSRRSADVVAPSQSLLKRSERGRSERGRSKVSNTRRLHLSKTKIHALDIPSGPVPGLSHGLDRVLFNPGIYRFQDPRSRVYNFDPDIEKILPSNEFDFTALRPYKIASKDDTLSEIASSHGFKYFSSTSSITSCLVHFHFLLSAWRPINISMLSRGFAIANGNAADFTLFPQAPVAIFLRPKGNVYAIDTDKSNDTDNPLSLVGQVLEKLFTVPKEDFNLFRKDPLTGTSKAKAASDREAFHYTAVGDMLVRSQLDGYDSRLPGAGIFDIKTRAVLPIRMDQTGKLEASKSYELRSSLGDFQSFEREYYDLLRSTLIKYSLQVRLGRMDGIFLAYHNVSRMFGFQYMGLEEMDVALHDTKNRKVGDQELAASLTILQDVFDRAVQRFPNRSIRIHIESRHTREPYMDIFAEPMTEEMVEKIQNKEQAHAAALEAAVLHSYKEEDRSSIDTHAEGSPYLQGQDQSSTDTHAEGSTNLQDAEERGPNDVVVNHEPVVHEVTPEFRIEELQCAAFDIAARSASLKEVMNDDANVAENIRQMEEIMHKTLKLQEGLAQLEDELPMLRNSYVQSKVITTTERPEVFRQLIQSSGCEIVWVGSQRPGEEGQPSSRRCLIKGTVENTAKAIDIVSKAGNKEVGASDDEAELRTESILKDDEMGISRQIETLHAFVDIQILCNKAILSSLAVLTKGNSESEETLDGGNKVDDDHPLPPQETADDTSPPASGELLALRILICQHEIDGSPTFEPPKLPSTDSEWTIDYHIQEITGEKARSNYQSCKRRREKAPLAANVGRHTRFLDSDFIRAIDAQSREGAIWRTEQDRLDAEREAGVVLFESKQTGDAKIGRRDGRDHSLEHVAGVEGYMDWLYAIGRSNE